MVRDFYRKFDTVFLLFILFDSSISLGMVYGQSASERRLELPNQITYQLETVWVRKIKDGNVIEEKAGPLEFLDEPYKYVIESLNTRKPVLK